MTEQTTEAEIAKRRDDAIRRALNTPPQPQNAMPKKRPAKAKGDAAEGPPKAARS